MTNHKLITNLSLTIAHPIISSSPHHHNTSLHHIQDGGRSYRMPVGQIHAMAHLLKQGLDRCNASLIYYNEAPVLLAEQDKQTIFGAEGAGLGAGDAGGGLGAGGEE
jgi:hypothetical protein